MSGLLKISEAAVLAIHTAALLGVERGRVLTTREIASFLKASEAHLSKVLQRLAKSGFVTSVRGPKGGFMLSGPPEEITLLEIYEAIDGPLGDTRCLLGAPVCDGHCIMGDVLCEVNRLVARRLSETKIAEVGRGLQKGYSGEKRDNQDRQG
jgi:Rrf2 family protein